MCIESDKLFDRRPAVVIFSLLVCMLYVPLALVYPIHMIAHNINNNLYIPILIGTVTIGFVWVTCVYYFWKKESERLNDQERLRLIRFV